MIGASVIVAGAYAVKQLVWPLRDTLVSEVVVGGCAPLGGCEAQGGAAHRGCDCPSPPKPGKPYASWGLRVQGLWFGSWYWLFTKPYSTLGHATKTFWGKGKVPRVTGCGQALCEWQRCCVHIPYSTSHSCAKYARSCCCSRPNHQRHKQCRSACVQIPLP